MSVSDIADAGPEPAFRLTRRRAALLHVMRYGAPPWWLVSFDDRCEASASECSPGRWVLCSGHVYGAAEIGAMVALGWIRIDGPPDRCGRPQTSAGPQIEDAWQRMTY